MAIKSLAVLFFTLLLTTLSNKSYASLSRFGPRFDPQECEDILKLNFAFLDTVRSNKFTGFQDGYEIYYRSSTVGLDNASDIWLRKDSTVVIMLRGTTSNTMSILEDFYCAMMPAKGTVQLDRSKSFDYTLATDPRAAVHAGFLIGFAYLAVELQPKIDELYLQGFRKFIIGGHSQGGALCYYFGAWLLQLRSSQVLKDIYVKTYASASPKMGNMYFAYDYDNKSQAKWSFSIVNTCDPVPEMPLTTQQLEIDMNEPNPILNLIKRFDDLPFPKRVVLKNAFGKMKKRAQKSSESYQKYLGTYVGNFIHKSLPEMSLPEAVPTTYFVRPGVQIVLSANEHYNDKYRDAPKYFHHGIDPYRFLLREYYGGLPEFSPLAKE